MNIDDQKSLQAPHSHFEQIVNNAADLIYSINSEGYFIYANNAFLNILGYSFDELKGKNLKEILTEEFEEEIGKFYKHQISNSETNSYREFPCINKSGDIIWLAQNGIIWKNDKKTLGLDFIARNISEQKKLHRNLNEKEKMYRSLFDVSPDAILIYEKNVFVFANKEAVKLLGAVSSEELIGKSFWEFMDSDYDEAIMQRIKDALSGKGFNPSIEKKINRLDGIKLDVEISATSFEYINNPAVLILMRNITRRKILEKELKQKQLEVTNLLDVLPGYAFLKDSSRKYIIANQRFCDVMRFKKEEIIGKSDLDLLPEEIAKKYHAEDDVVLNEERKLFISEDKITENGKEKIVATRKIPLKDKEGKVIGLIGLGFDVTELKQAEAAVKTYSKELEALNSSKDKFFSIVSHDLKSPFQGLLGLSTIISEDIEDLSREEIKFFTDKILESTKNIYNLIENLLHWSRLQTNRTDMVKEKVDLLEEILNVINLLGITSANKNIKLNYNVEENSFALADSNMTNTIIRNLISNAIKFTNEGGNVDINVNQEDEFVKVCVKDSGIGIHKDTLENLFRLDSPHSTLGTNKEFGTGLGLLICKDMVEKLGGNIYVKSKIEEGSEFTFTIPKFQK